MRWPTFAQNAKELRGKCQKGHKTNDQNAVYQLTFFVLYYPIQHHQTRGYSCAQGLGLTVHNCAPSSHPAVRNRALPLDLVVRNRAPSFFIGTTPDGWGFLVVFSISANESCCPKPTKKQTQVLSRAPLWRGKHAAPGGYISTATLV